MLPVSERKLVRMLSEKAAVPGPAKGTLLCIDDALPILEILIQLLGKCGYSVLTSPSAKHGLMLFEITDVDIVILDYDMPEMSGYEVALVMKRTKPAVPIIMHSGSADIPEKTFEVVDAIVPKGTNLQPLISQLAGIMSAFRKLPKMVL